MASQTAQPLQPIKFGVPDAEQILPTITPFQVALCFLVKGYLSPTDGDPGGNWLQRQALGDALLTAIRQCHSIVDPNINELGQQLKDTVTATLKDDGQYGDLVVVSLHHHMGHHDMLDRLVVLFDLLSQMVTTSTNARAEESVGADDNSVMGFFLRKCWCDFTALPLESVCELAEACEAFAAVRHLASHPQLPAHVPPPDDARTSAPTYFRPRVAVERCLMKHQRDIETRLGMQSTQDLAAPLRQLAATTPGLPLCHLAQATLAVVDRDPGGVEESIHRYGDSSADKYVQSIGVVSCGDAALPPRVPKPAASPLGLAAMHARLGHVQAAMLALDEAMRTLQQAGDDASLAHALGVLCQVMELANPGTIDPQGEQLAAPGNTSVMHRHCHETRKLLQRCLLRAEELKLPHLAAFARLSISRSLWLRPAARPKDEAIAAETDCVLPCLAAVDIAAAGRYVSHSSFIATMAAAVPVPPASSSGLACLRIVKGLGDMFSPMPEAFGTALMGAQASSAAEVGRLAAASLLLKASSWHGVGGHRLAMSHLSSFLALHFRTASSEDKATALAHAAVAAAEFHGFAAAERIIALTDRIFLPGATEPAPIHAARLMIAHRRAVHRKDVKHALEFAARLVAMVPLDGSGGGSALKVDAEEAAVLALLSGGYLAEAEKGARIVFDMAQKAYLPLCALRLLVLIGRVHLEAGSWAVSIPYFLSVLQQSQGCSHADMIAAEATVLLACARRGICREQLGRAIKEVESVLPLILAHGCLDLRSRSRLALAELILDKEQTREGAGKAAHVAVPLLRAAARDAERLEDWERVSKCWHLVALTLDAKGDIRARDAAANRWLRLKEQFMMGSGVTCFPSRT